MDGGVLTQMVVDSIPSVFVLNDCGLTVVVGSQDSTGKNESYTCKICSVSLSVFLADRDLKYDGKLRTPRL